MASENQADRSAAPGAGAPDGGAHYRRGLGLKAEVAAPLADDYTGGLVRFARDAGFRFFAGSLEFRLAREFGFCYGVDRAVQYAYEARLRFPDRRIFITGEIIHNPYTNRRLRDLGIEFLEGDPASEEKFAGVRKEDVVLLPAFGVEVAEMEILRRRGAILVDTTCGSVMNVWKSVERFRKAGFTSVVHGKYAHEETRATVSRAGRYIVVRDMAETDLLCSYIEAGGTESRSGNGASEAPPFTREAFLDRFSGAVSPGFDPDAHLARLGVANQTTMLGAESLAIAHRLRDSMIRRYGEPETERRFRSIDTICSATQDRQDAVMELLDEPLDLVLVIGGYNSSNTAHLAQICSRRVPTYHIADPDCMISADDIRFKPVGRTGETSTRGWLPDGRARIGLTAGASTPDIKVHESILRVLALRGLTARDCRAA